MFRSANSWADRFESKPGVTILQAGVTVIVILFLLTALIWGGLTGFSYWWGQAGAVQQKNSTQNFIAAQKQFHEDQNDVQTDVVKIQAARQALNAHNAQPVPADSLGAYEFEQETTSLQTTLTGLQQSCDNTVADYDTAAQSYLTENWRDAGLPPTLDPSVCQ